VPSIDEKSESSTASRSSRRTDGNSRIRPLCIQSQRPWRKGCVFVSWIAVPVEARMCAKKRGDETPAASSRRLRSFQAGCVLR
jgi:hypothetical protein